MVVEGARVHRRVRGGVTGVEAARSVRSAAAGREVRVALSGESAAQQHCLELSSVSGRVELWRLKVMFSSQPRFECSRLLKGADGSTQLNIGSAQAD